MKENKKSNKEKRGAPKGSKNALKSDRSDHLHIRINPDLKKKLIKYTKTTKQSQADIIEHALIEILSSS